MLHALILICATAVADCTPATAIDVMRTPVATAFPTACFLQGQAFLAQMEIGRALRTGDRVVIHCEHDRH